MPIGFPNANSSIKTSQAACSLHKKNMTAGLSLSTQKSLLLDIKSKGGLKSVIDKAFLEEICNKNTEAYGGPGTPLCRQVQNCVDYLKKNPQSYEMLQKQLLGSVIDRYSLTPTDLSKQFESLAILSSKVTLMEESNNMSCFFGKVDYDDTHEVHSCAWKNHGILIWKAKEVSVGSKPTISTDIYTVMFQGVDPHFFTVEDFEPYKLTQISAKELVVEYPVAGYEFLFGQHTDENVEMGQDQFQEELQDEEKQEIEGQVMTASNSVS